jgi:lipoprotein-releasing system permease protein
MSKLPFELMLALRYLRPKRTFVSIITVISILGVMLGVAVLIIVISVMSGFDHELQAKVFGFNAHLKVVAANNQTMESHAVIASAVASNKNVTGVAPFVVGQVLLETQPAYGQAMFRAPVVRGIEPEAEATVSTIGTNIVEGAFDVSGRGLLIGTALARSLELRVGDHVAVLSHKQFRQMREQADKKNAVAVLPDDYEIRGVFDAGHEEFNSLFVISSLANAQRLYDLEDSDSIHGLTVRITDPFQATAVARELKQALGPGYWVTTWMEDSPMMLAVMVEKSMMLYILFFIVIVAAFGITCTLITFIVMKTREIGLLKALGASNGQVMWVFLVQSLIVSILGVLTGLGLGLLAIAYRNEFLSLMRQWTGLQLFPADIYGFSQLPALILPGDIAIICGGSLVICLLAAAFPARHASRLNPVEALRHE